MARTSGEPRTCTRGHPMAYPNVIVSWEPCQCRLAAGRPRGHTTMRCLTCDERWYQGGHEVGEHRTGPA